MASFSASVSGDAPRRLSRVWFRVPRRTSPAPCVEKGESASGFCGNEMEERGGFEGLRAVGQSLVGHRKTIKGILEWGGRKMTEEEEEEAYVYVCSC